ncbi:MAG: hypothetical protein ACRC26_07415 [Bacteroidales bacterium]
MKNDVISITLRITPEVAQKIELIKQSSGEKTTNKAIVMLIEQHEELLKRYNKLLEKEKDMMKKEKIIDVKYRKLKSLAQSILGQSE